MIAAKFNRTQSATRRRSSGVSRPATTRGAGRTATTAVSSIVILLPWVVLTLIRTSCRALPRGLTQTAMGKPVMRGERFVMKKISSESSGAGASETALTDSTIRLLSSIVLVLPPFPPVQKRQALKQMHILLVFEERAVERRDQLFRVAGAQHFGRNVLDKQQLKPVEQLRGRGLLLQPRYLADVIEDG